MRQFDNPNKRVSYLNWISDEKLRAEVGYLLDVARSAKEAKRRNPGTNVIDPFGAVIEMAGFEQSFDAWVDSEIARQAQKSLQNHIGEFHQKILGAVGSWQDLGVGTVGLDVLCEGKKLIGEIKNKHNTVSGGKLKDVYYEMRDLVMPKNSRFKGFTAYFVTIIPKKKARFDVPFTPPDKTTGARCPTNELIRTIDGASFYNLVTGERDALANRFKAIPDVLRDLGADPSFIPGAEVTQPYFDAAFG